MDHRKRRVPGAIAVAALGGIVLASSGCISLDDVTADQPGVIGDVVVSEPVCISGSPGCGNADNYDVPGVGPTGTAQMLLGYRVPAAIVAPATLTADDPLVAFAPSPGYAAELERLSPAGPGRKWVGFISSALSFSPVSDLNVVVSAAWALPRSDDGSPFTGPVAYRPVVGFRAVGDTHPATEPVVCDVTSLGKPTANTICVDSPLLATIAGPDLTRPTRDLGILVGATATGAAGTSVTVPFTMRYAGTVSASAEVALSAATTVPGGAVTVVPGSIVPAADSTNPVSIAVAVPAGTAPGTYDVTLTARVGTQTRVRVGKLTVTPGAVTPPPVTTLRLGGTLPGRLTLLAARTGGVRVSVRSNRSGRAVVRLVQRGKTLAAKTVRLRNGATTVVLRSRRVAAGGYRVTVTFTATGKVATLRGTLRAR